MCEIKEVNENVHTTTVDVCSLIERVNMDAPWKIKLTHIFSSELLH
jgi:hydrogenase maturation factor